MKNAYRVIIGMLFGICVMSMVPQRAYAGDINANEASVISAASGTFTYNGKQYKASSEWVAYLQARLSADGTDLTAEQASSAVSQMFGNIGRGVSEGYLIEVDASGKPVSGSEANVKSPEEALEEWTTAEGDDGDESDSANSNKSKTDKATEDKDYVIIQGLNGNQTSSSVEDGTALQSDTTYTMPNQKKSSASVYYDSTTGKIQINQSKNEKKDVVSIGLKMAKLRYVWIALVLMCVIFVVGCILASLKRRKFRGILYKVIGLVVVCDTALVILLGGILGTTLKTSMLSQSLNSSNYYHAVYGEFKGEEKLLTGILGYSDDVLSEVIDYRELSLFAKKNVQMRLQDRTKELETATAETKAGLQKEVEQALIRDEMAQKKDGKKVVVNATSRTELSKALVKEVTSLTNVPYVTALKNQLDQMRSKILISFLTGVLLLIGCGILLWNLQHHRYKGIQCMAIGALIGTILAAIPVLIMYFGKFYESIYVDPYYLYTFLMAYCNNILYMFMGALAGGLIFFAVLMVVRKTLKGNQ